MSAASIDFTYRYPFSSGLSESNHGNGVRVTKSHGPHAWDLAAQGTEVHHQVRLRPEADRCTCPWFNPHQGERGPCKHILAARLLVDGEQDSEGVKGP